MSGKRHGVGSLAPYQAAVRSVREVREKNQGSFSYSFISGEVEKYPDFTPMQLLDEASEMTRSARSELANNPG